LGLTQTLALELASDNIRVNAVCPGPIEGERIYQLLRMHSEAENIDYQTMCDNWKDVPMKRFIDPAEVANVVLFLAGDASSAMTGQALNITGGLIMS
jgi:NAD(P)-dependent dehydrogenase (short-subunit alcohol dehydrogenase family)